MATSIQTRIDRENIGNSVLKNNVCPNGCVFVRKPLGQRGLSAKTPRKALGDLGNIQNGTGKKYQTPKPSKVKIFNETPKAKTSVKSKKTTFSVLNTHKVHSKLSHDVQMKTKSEDTLPEIENMIPFVDQEKDLPRPDYITKLLKDCRLLNPLLLATPTLHKEDLKTPSHYEFEPFDAPLALFDEAIANIIGYDEKPELVELDPHFVLDSLPPLDDIDLSSFD